MLLDAASKWAATYSCKEPATSFAGCSVSYNSVFAFSVPAPYIVVGGFRAIALGLIVFFALRYGRKSPILWGVVAGAGAANTLEFFMFGSITDFMVFGPIPHFNVADALLTFSVVYMLAFPKRVFSGKIYS